jgi:hypothetical protein
MDADEPAFTSGRCDARRQARAVLSAGSSDTTRMRAPALGWDRSADPIVP